MLLLTLLNIILIQKYHGKANIIETTSINIISPIRNTVGTKNNTGPSLQNGPEANNGAKVNNVAP